MKQYYTLVQDTLFCVDKRSLSDYLTEQGIEHSIGADYAQEFKRLNRNLASTDAHRLVSVCVALIEEHELSAIKLSVDGVTVEESRPSINLKNKVRGWFKWIVD